MVRGRQRIPVFTGEIEFFFLLLKFDASFFLRTSMYILLAYEINVVKKRLIDDVHPHTNTHTRIIVRSISLVGTSRV